MASLTIQFTRRALIDLNEILGFIAQDNLAAAEKLSERIEKGLERVALSQFLREPFLKPWSGRNVIW